MLGVKRKQKSRYATRAIFLCIYCCLSNLLKKYFIIHKYVLRGMRRCFVLQPLLMYPQNLLRVIVSIPKQTYSDANHLLDLSYISPRIIVAAGPSDDAFVNLFRSPINKVVDYLNKNYVFEGEVHWHIWNLRGEGVGYNDKVVDGNWSHHPFPDHMPPTIELIDRIVKEIYQFLSSSSKNVALIHCKEGKGRSGTICCSYLMYEAKLKGIYLSPEEAVDMFTKHRMRRYFGEGISIKSQLRFLHYWKRYLQFAKEMQINFGVYNLGSSVPYSEQNSVVTKITIFRPSLLLVLSKLQLSSYVETANGLQVVPITDRKLKFPSIQSSTCYYEVALNIPISKNLKNIMVSFKKQICFSYLWFNVYFETLGSANRPLPTIECDSIIPCRRIFNWSDFDGYKGTQNKKMPRLFDRLEVQWIFHYRSHY